MSENTQDLSKFGFRELDIAADLLKAFANPSKNSIADDLELSGGVQLEFNPNSGNVFLVDEDYNVAMLNDDNKLENWLNCGNCGYENWASEFTFVTGELNSIDDGRKCPECKEYL